MHALAYRLRGDRPPDLRSVMSSLARDFDGAYNIVFLDGLGRMFVARDPLGLRPLSWSVQGRLFAAASESVALSNLGFTDIRSLEPGEMAIIEKGRLRFERFARLPAAGPLLLRVDLLRQRRQRDRRVQRVRGPLAVGRAAGALEDQKMDAILHRRARARHRKGRRRRLRLPAGHSLRGGADPQPLRRADVHPAQAAPAAAALKSKVHAPAGHAEGQTASSSWRTPSSARRRWRAWSRCRRARPGPGSARPRGLSADRRAVFLRHRHVHPRCHAHPAVGWAAPRSFSPSWHWRRAVVGGGRSMTTNPRQQARRRRFVRPIEPADQISHPDGHLADHRQIQSQPASTTRAARSRSSPCRAMRATICIDLADGRRQGIGPGFGSRRLLDLAATRRADLGSGRPPDAACLRAGRMQPTC